MSGTHGLDEPVELADSLPEWPRLFAAEADGLRRALGPAAEVEHIGSTAVPGLVAKPIESEGRLNSERRSYAHSHFFAVVLIETR